jgi:peroxisomal membrane protein 4
MPSPPAGFSDHSPLSSFWMEELYAILAALQGGARYGFKIRVPHALVMTFLFKNELSALQKIRAISILTIEHASKLAAFATIYKVCVSL